MMNHMIAEKVDPEVVLGATAAGISDVATTAIDMQMYEGVMYSIVYGTVTDAQASPCVQVQHSAASGSGFVTVTDDDYDAPALEATDDNKVALVNIYKPLKRYSKLNFKRDGGSTGYAITSVTAFKYGMKKGAPPDFITAKQAWEPYLLNSPDITYS